MLEYLSIVGIAAALSLAIVNGANNAANIIGTAVGAKALRLRKALMLAAIFDFLGSAIFGYFVTKTFISGIINVNLFDNITIAIAAFSALFGAAIWVALATKLRIPMSIIQSIIGGLLGVGLIAGGLNAVNWFMMALIALSWFVIPLATMVIALAISLILTKIKKFKALFSASLFFTFLIVTLPGALLLSAILKDTPLVCIYSFTAGALAVVVFYITYVIRTKNMNVKQKISYVTRYLSVYAIITSAFVHGAQNVGTSAGPLILIVSTLGGGLGEVMLVKILIIILCASGIALGIALWGYSVVGTIGEQITTLTRLTAFIAQLSMFTSVIIISRLGIPTSTVLAIVGGVMGVGLRRGIKAVNLRILVRIMSMWVLAIPAAAAISAGLYLLIAYII